MMPWLWIVLVGQAAALPTPRPDFLSRLVDIAQVILVPIGSALLVVAWDTWKKVRAVFTVCFGRPEIKKDDGLVGMVSRMDKTIDRFDRDLDRLCESSGVIRAEIRE